MATGTIFSSSTGFPQPDPSLDLPGDIVSFNGSQIVIRNADPATGVLDGTVSVYIADPSDPLVYDANGIPVDGTIVEVQHQSTDDPATQVLLAELTGLSVSVFDLFIPLAMGELEAHFRVLQAGNETWTSADGDGSEIFGFDGDDNITGSAFDDVLNGGRGSDIVKGGRGNDLIISESDAGEQRIGQLAVGMPTREDPDNEVNNNRQKLKGWEDQALRADDILFGGEGMDTFLFTPLLNGKLEIL